MRRALSSLFVLALVLFPAAARAAGGHDRAPVTGTVAKVEGSRLDLKAADGKTVTVTLTTSTAYFKGKDPATKSDLEAGVRVAVETADSKAGPVAKVVRIGTAAEAAAWTCPMHAEVKSAGPGRCPKCGMLLEKKKA